MCAVQEQYEKGKAEMLSRFTEIDYPYTWLVDVIKKVCLGGNKFYKPKPRWASFL